MANLFMRFPGGAAKAFTMSCDDGGIDDTHLLEIMNNYGLKGTFNLNSSNYLPVGQKDTSNAHYLDKRLDQYLKYGHEVAAHSLTHAGLTLLPTQRLLYEVFEDKQRLEALTGNIIRGFAYPFGLYNPAVENALKSSGYVYARTAYSNEKFELPEDWFRLEATCHHDNPHLMELATSFIHGEFSTRPKLFYVWGHSNEFSQHNNWNRMEELGKLISGKSDIWYANNLQIFDYISAYHQLRFNTAMSVVENPTATDIYFRYNDINRVILSGSTLHLE